MEQQFITNTGKDLEPDFKYVQWACDQLKDVKYIWKDMIKGLKDSAQNYFPGADKEAISLAVDKAIEIIFKKPIN